MSEVNEKDYELAFQIIVTAGDAKSYAYQAIDAASEYDFDKYEELLKKAKEGYIKCHEIQTGLLNKEAGGEKNDVNIFLVHGQDHLTMASMAIDNAQMVKKIYERQKELEDKINELGGEN